MRKYPAWFGKRVTEKGHEISSWYLVGTPLHLEGANRKRNCKVTSSVGYPTAMMVSTRLWVAGVVQVSRDRSLADRLMSQVRRAAQVLRPLLVLTDGWAAYVRRVGVSEIPGKHGRGREQEPLGQELTRRGNSKGTVACS